MTEEQHPVVELRPWEARNGVPRRTVWVLVEGRPQRFQIRIKAGVTNRALLRLPGDVYLRVRVTSRPVVYRAVVGVLLFAGLVAHVLPSTLVLGAAWALVELCRSRRDRVTGFRRQLCLFGVLYLVPRRSQPPAMSSWAWWVAISGDTLGIDSLRSLERALATASSFFSEKLKLGEFGPP